MKFHFSVMPFLVALIVGLMPQALNIYDVHARNVGTVEVDPWRARSSGIANVAAVALAWLRQVFTSRGASIAGAMALALLVAYLSASPTAGVLMAVTPLVALREKREGLIRQAGELKGLNGAFETDDKRAQFDKLMTDIEALGAQATDLERVERLAAVERMTLPESQRTTPAAAGEAAAAKELREKAMGQYLRGVRLERMTPEVQDALFRSQVSFDAPEQRDMATISGAGGGFVVAPDTSFYGSIVQALKFFGGMEAAGSEVITTSTGADLPIPTSDDTANVGSIVGEGGAHTGGTTPTLGQKVLKSYLYSSLVLKVSLQFLQDSAINVEAWLGARIGERLGRIQNTHFTMGTGVNQPEGLTQNITVGRQAAVGNTTTFPFDDVFRTIHSVDIAYRNARCKWMMADTTALALRLAKDGQGRYLWPEMGNVQVGQPITLAGYPVVINNDVAAMAASVKAATFGDHSHYKIRRVSGLTIVRLNELYAENGQVGFLGFMRADGGYVNAGQNPVKAFQNSAT